MTLDRKKKSALAVVKDAGRPFCMWDTEQGKIFRGQFLLNLLNLEKSYRAYARRGSRKNPQ